MKQRVDLERRACPIAAAIHGSRRRTAMAVLFCLGSASAAGLAYAQDEAATPAPQDAPATAPAAEASSAPAAPAPATVAADDSDVSEVLVTARRRAESAQSVPLAVSVLGGEQLEEMRIQNLDSLQAVVPTLSVSSASGRPNAPVYSLRGIRPTEAIYGQDPTVAVYLSDFVLSPSQGSNFGMYDLASVQVLKGPQGTLFGRNTTGGAVLLSPKRPGRTLGGDVMVGYGNYGLAETQLGLDVPLADNFALRLAGRTVNSDGYQTNVVDGPLNGAKLGGEDTRSVRLSAVWDITENIENYTIATWDHKRTTGRGMVLKAVNGANPIVRCYDGPANPNGECFPGDQLVSIFDALERAQGRDIRKIESDSLQFDDTKIVGIINTTTAQLGGDVTLKSIAGYRDVKSSQYIDLDASPVPGMLDSSQTAELKHASYELQLLGTAFDDRLDWVTGLYWYYEDGFENSPGSTYLGHPAFDVAAGGNPFMQRGEVENTSYSIFAQGSMKLTDALALTVGARMTRDEKKMTLSTMRETACQLDDPNSNPAAPTKLPLANCAVSLSDSFEQPTGTVSLDYKVAPGVMVYAASRYGYRAGGFNLRATKQIEYEPFDAETVLDGELGVKSDWSIGSWKMRSNASAYYQWYNDIQRTVAAPNSDGTPGSAVQNAAKAEVFGFELEQTISPTRNLSLQLNYAFVDPKYKDWKETNIVGGVPVVLDQSDTPFYFTPKHAGSATLSYTLPLSGDAGALTFTATAAYKDDVWMSALLKKTVIDAHPADVRQFLQQEAYWLVDLGASWNGIMGSNLDFMAYVKNVTDEEYAVGGIQLYTTFGVLAHAYGDPRTYGMQLRYRF